MHDTAYEAGRRFFACYWRPGFNSILDVGAYDVNGTLRDFCPEGARYVGVDISPGPSVDVVRENPTEPLPFGDRTFDAIVSSSCFEHDDAFWVSFIEMLRVLKPGGYIYLNVPSNGTYHTYPHDNWRFYPDAGLALVAWARRSGYADAKMLESLTLRRGDAQWNDFVAVFGNGTSAPPERMLVDEYADAFNMRRGEDAEVMNHSPQQEERLLLRRAERRLADLEPNLHELRQISHSFTWKLARPLYALEQALRRRPK